MKMEELDWRAIEHAVFSARRGWALLLKQNSADELKAMENEIHRLWSRIKRVVEMKELIEIEYELKFVDGRVIE